MLFLTFFADTLPRTELACALSLLVSGGGLPELVGTVSNIYRVAHGAYKSEVRLWRSRGTKHDVIRAPLLCEYDHSTNGVKRLYTGHEGRVSSHACRGEPSIQLMYRHESYF